MERTIHLLIMYTMLVLSILLFHKGRKHQQSLILAVYAAVEVITNGLNSLTLSSGWEFFDLYPYSHFIYKPLYCLWVPLFYFYIKSTLTDRVVWNKKRLVHFIPFMIYLGIYLGIWVFKGNTYIWGNLYHEGTFIYRIDFSVDVFTKLQYIIYNVLLINILLGIEQKKRQEVELKAKSPSLRWYQFIVYGYALACLIGIINFVIFQFDSQLGSTINLISVSYFFLFFFVIFYDTITRKSFNNSIKKENPSELNDELKTLMKKIDVYVKDQQGFLQAELTLQQTALELNEKERDISKAINTIQHRNFKDYLSFYRIKHACKLLLSDKNKPIFEVMYDSGFNTKGAFNLAFKKVTGKTPTAYREKFNE